MARPVTAHSFRVLSEIQRFVEGIVAVQQIDGKLIREPLACVGLDQARGRKWHQRGEIDTEANGDCDLVAVRQVR
jgi:hypothetical protein